MTQEVVPAGAPMGRPHSYTSEIGRQICERLALGETLRRITIDDAMPSQATVYRWLLSRPDDPNAEALNDFREQYREAREMQGDTFHDEMVDIADDGANDYMERERADGSSYTVFNGEHVQRSKLRIETRKWMAEIARPKKYGPKLQVESRNRTATMPVVPDDPAAATEAYKDFLKGGD